MATVSASPTTASKAKYIPRGRNQLHTIFEKHFEDFCDRYEERYAKKYGRFRLERIQEVGERFCTCGDYLQGIARIKCTKPNCDHDYFRRGRPVPSVVRGSISGPGRAALMQSKADSSVRRASDTRSTSEPTASTIRLYRSESSPTIFPSRQNAFRRGVSPHLHAPS